MLRLAEASTIRGFQETFRKSRHKAVESASLKQEQQSRRERAMNTRQQTGMSQWLVSPARAARTLVLARRSGDAERATRRLVGAPGRSRSTYRGLVL